MADKKDIRHQPIYRHDPIGEYLEAVSSGQLQLEVDGIAGSHLDVAEKEIEEFRKHVLSVLTQHPCRGCPNLTMADTPPFPADANRGAPTVVFGRQNSTGGQLTTVEEYAAYNYEGQKPFCTARVTVKRHPTVQTITAVQYMETWHRCPLFGVSSVNEALDSMERRIQTLTSQLRKLEKLVPSSLLADPPEDSGSRIMDIPSAEPVLPGDEETGIKVIRPMPTKTPPEKNGLEKEDPEEVSDKTDTPDEPNGEN